LRAVERKVRPGQTNSRRKLALAATSLIGLLLAVAAMMPAATAVESLPARLVLDLPGWLAYPFVVLLGLEALFILLVLVSGAGQRRRPVELPKRKAMAPGLVLLMVVLLWIGFRDHLSIDIRDVWLGPQLTGPPPEALATPGDAVPPPVRSPWVTGLMETFLLALAVLGFAVMAWLFLGFWPERRQQQATETAPAALQAAVEESLEDLRQLADPRVAIIRCYGRFERALAGADVRRPPWETAAEFMRTALAHRWLPGDAVRELTSLFELARFSRRQLGPAHRERAWQALMSVKAALAAEEARRASAA
jgi:hypothetical protein